MGEKDRNNVFYDRNQYTERLNFVAQRRTINKFGLEGRSACCSGNGIMWNKKSVYEGVSDLQMKLK
jgi:hypothetical protein